MQKLGYALLSVALVSLSVWAQNPSEYRAGRLVKVTDESVVLPDRVGKTAYLLRIRDGSNEYFALYNVNQLFGHDRSSQLKPDSDVQYRISGKNLFVKIQDKDIKGRLCEMVNIRGSAGMKCGDLILFTRDPQ
jgi:hypothetical protein